MENTSALKVLLVAEGSGGHLIPALQVAGQLSKVGVMTKVWYTERRKAARLLKALAEASARAHGSRLNDAAQPLHEVEAISLGPCRTILDRFRQMRELWVRSQRCFESFAPDVVAGFGGWTSAPVVLAARRRHIRCLIHEQNVEMGRANRFLARWVDRVAVSFEETQQKLNKHRTVVTGLPIRESIGRECCAEETEQFGLDNARPTILVIGGSQGAHAVNELVVDAVRHFSDKERSSCQMLHMTGSTDEIWVRDIYLRYGVTSWVAPSLLAMDAAYAQSDIVIARAGASTIAELARCGKPAILIPYPHAGGHQRINAKLAESVGGCVVIEEGKSQGLRLLAVLRRLLADKRLRTMMGCEMRRLAVPDATERLTKAILELRKTNGKIAA